MNTSKIKNKVSQMLYRPSKGKGRVGLNFKTLDELDKAIEEELVAFMPKKKSKAKKDESTKLEKASVDDIIKKDGKEDTGEKNTGDA